MIHPKFQEAQKQNKKIKRIIPRHIKMEQFKISDPVNICLVYDKHNKNIQ